MKRSPLSQPNHISPMLRNIILSLLLASIMAPAAEPNPVRVLVWDEQQPAQAKAYENFLGNAIADHLTKQPGFVVKSVSLGSPDQGLDAATLDNTDVVIWWGHKQQQDVKPEAVNQLIKRLKSGRLSLIALHSAHWSQPFIEAMSERAREDALKAIPVKERPSAKLNLLPRPQGAPKRDDPLTPLLSKLPSGEWQLVLPNCCFPAYRGDGQPSHVRTLLPDHPIAKDIPATWDISQTEMYDEPFHVPPPDAVVFEERWDRGEHFRSGCVWRVGQGRVFYFRPGHETYPVFRQALPLKVVENAARWLGAQAHP